MMRRLTESEVMAALPSLLRQLDQHSIVITRDGRDVGALISLNDYKLLQQIKAAPSLPALRGQNIQGS
jgi:prevent-host-death family protein